MSRIHYFQRYSSRENTVTNNTLQLFARIYDYSARVASRLLSDLIDDEIYIGLEIGQQERGLQSIPDGTLLQRSFKISIEAKVDAPINEGQLARHARSFGPETQKILLLLTKAQLSANEQRILDQTRAAFPAVTIRHIMFEDICNAIRSLFKPHEDAMIELTTDYIEYCNETGLFDQSCDLMRIVPCGHSVAINQQHQIYFHSSDRRYTPHSYIGIYAQKAVRAVLQTKSVFDVAFDGEILRKELVEGEPTDKYDNAIRGIIHDAKAQCDYDIEYDHRFFCGAMARTYYEKESPGGIQGARFIDLREIVGEYSDIEDLAAKLREKTWT